MLKQWFRPRRPLPPTEPAGVDTAALERLVRNRELVVVHCSRTGQSYQSMVLALRSGLGEIVLDEFFPRAGTEALQRGDLATVTCPAAAIHFTARLLGTEEREGHVARRMELPNHIGGGLRQAYRVYVENEPDLGLELRLGADQPPLDCRIVNLSVDGIKIDLDGDHRAGLDPSTPLTDCRLQLPGTRPLVCTLQVRNLSIVHTPGLRTLVGARLTLEQPGDSSRLNRYLAAVQRRQRRRQIGRGRTRP